MTVTTAPHARGRICYRRRKIVSQVLAGQRVGVNQVDDYLGSSPSCHYELGYFDDETLRPLIKKTKNLSVPIEVFYSQRRRHSTLGQISPAEFERRATHAA